MKTKTIVITDCIWILFICSVHHIVTAEGQVVVIAVRQMS
jgi:hypothetical protein